MRVLIVEPRAHGHHFSLYLRHILREIRRRGWHAHVLTTTDALEHPAMEIISSEFVGVVSFSTMNVPHQWMSGATAVLMANQIFYFYAVAAGYRPIAALGFDVVFLMDLDSVDKALALFGSPFRAVAVCGVFVHLKFHWPAIGLGGGGRSPALGRWLFQRLLTKEFLRSVCVIDESFARYLDRHAVACAQKVAIVAEPAVAQSLIARRTARDRLDLMPAEFIVLVYGAHTSRKGIHHLLDAVSRAGSAGIRILVAGDMDGSVRALLDGEQARLLQGSGRLKVIDRFVGDGEEIELFCAADVVWLGYSQDFVGQSAILPLAAAYGVPVLAKSGGMIGSITREHGIGLLIEPDLAAEVAEALFRLRDEPGLLGALREKALAFARTRTMERFAGAICTSMEARLA
jgi:glycosyltransferase involved in cell wall biosynthesis